MAYCTSADLTVSISTTEVGRLSNDFGGIEVYSRKYNDLGLAVQRVKYGSIDVNSGA